MASSASNSSSSRTLRQFILKYDGLSLDCFMRIVDTRTFRADQEQFLSTHRQPTYPFRKGKRRLHNHGRVEITGNDGLIELE